TRGIVENDTVTDLPLGWESSPIAQDLSDALDGTRVLIENDAKLGALGVFPSDFHGRGLFVTIGTGIGAGLVIDGKLSRDLARTEVGLMRIEHEGKIATWEEFASGAAWFERSGGRTGYEMPADDPIWRWYAENLTVGMAILLPIFYPEIVIIGGKMAEFFDKYADDLRRIVAEHTWPPVAQVEITTAFDYHYVTNRGALVFGLKQMEKGDEN
ncbi:ROK family protein, partial [Candidatus Saccharibacteria bacterium]|nr:ROK family protein [Candidatus Saccharibacteria bacterium]